MATACITATCKGGWNYGIGTGGTEQENYDAARATADDCIEVEGWATASRAEMWIGQEESPNNSRNWFIHRSFLDFDTPSASLASITDASLFLHSKSGLNESANLDVDVAVQVYSAYWTQELCANSDDNFDLAIDTAASAYVGAIIDTCVTVLSPSTWYSMEVAPSAINTGCNTRFTLCAEDDYDATITACWGVIVWSGIDFDEADGGEQRAPILLINYALGDYSWIF
jgi:hypothetical protein